MSKRLPPAPLDPEAIAAALRDLPLWQYDQARRALFRRLVLEDFADAIGLMVRVAVEAERTDHHPEWTNVYNRLDIWLTTHDCDGPSDRDLAMARHIDMLTQGGKAKLARENCAKPDRMDKSCQQQ